MAARLSHATMATSFKKEAASDLATCALQASKNASLFSMSGASANSVSIQPARFRVQVIIRIQCQGDARNHPSLSKLDNRREHCQIYLTTSIKREVRNDQREAAQHALASGHPRHWLGDL